MTPIVIPAYEPDERLLQLLETLRTADLAPVVIVDDGSGSKYKEIFERAQAYVQASGGAVLTQEYADMIGADAYAKDAMATVRYADSIFLR